jgi:hypothetical protein
LALSSSSIERYVTSRHREYRTRDTTPPICLVDRIEIRLKLLEGQRHINVPPPRWQHVFENAPNKDPGIRII